MSRSRTLSLVLLAAVAGCGGGDDPVSVSAPIGINLKVKSGDVKAANAISNAKGITTESGNPWGVFVADARTKLGHDPSSVKLSKLDLLMAATSTGVTGLDEIFTGEVDVQLVFDTSNNVVPVAKITNPTGRGPLPMTVQFDFAAITPQDLPKFYQGSFKVVLAGTAAATFMSKGADADLQGTFEFQAFE